MNSKTVTFSDSTVLKLGLGVDVGSWTHQQTAIDNDDATKFKLDSGGDVDAFLDKFDSTGLYSTVEFKIDGTDLVVKATENGRDNAGANLGGVMNRYGLGGMKGNTNPFAGNWYDIIKDMDSGTNKLVDPDNEKAKDIAELIYELTNKPHLYKSREAEAGLSVLTGMDIAKSVNVATNTARRITGNIFKRILHVNDMRAAVQDYCGVDSAYGSYVMNNDFANRFWVGGLGIWEDGGRYKGNAGYDYDSYGVQLGYDRIFGPVTVGGGFAYSKGGYDDLAALSNDSDVENFSFNLYATYNHYSGFFASIIGGYTYSDFDMEQVFGANGGGVPMREKSDYHANTWSIGTTLGYDWRPTNRLTVTPSIGVHYYNSRTNRFNSVYRDSLRARQDFAEMPVGLNAKYDVPVGGCGDVISFEGGASYTYRFSNDGGHLGGFRYNGIVPTNKPSELKGPRHFWNVGGGVTYSAGRWDIGVKYDYYASKSSDAHMVRAQVGLKF